MTVTVKNKERLLAKMAKLPLAIQLPIKDALEKGATEIVALMRNLVPVKSGRLRNSIGWTFGKAPAGSVQLASATAGEFTVTIFAGNDKVIYGRWVEFGTTKNRAQPFFFVSYRALRKRSRSRITRNVNKAFKAVANG